MSLASRSVRFNIILSISNTEAYGEFAVQKEWYRSTYQAAEPRSFGILRCRQEMKELTFTLDTVTVKTIHIKC